MIYSVLKPIEHLVDWFNFLKKNKKKTLEGLTPVHPALKYACIKTKVFSMPLSLSG